MVNAPAEVSAGKAAGFDPFSPEFRANPRAHYDHLLTHSPGFITMDGVPSAYVTTWAQTTAVLKDYKTFSSKKPPNLPGMQRIDFFNSLPVMNYSDPPDHMRRRRSVNAAFTPKRTQWLNDKALVLIDGLIDAALEKGSFDVAGDITRPLSREILLTHFMSVAPEDHHVFLTYSSKLPLLDKLKLGDPKPAEYLAAWEAGSVYCRQQIARARSGELPDSLIALIAASEEGGDLSDDEMMAMMVLMLTGGLTSVAGIAGSAIRYLAENPDVADRIRSDPSLAKIHLEETLRIDAPVALVLRFAMHDTEIGGHPIPAGMPIYAMISVACHDPAVFPEPSRFDIDRPNLRDHLAFGYGIHTCIGNSITRNVVPLLINRVVERMPGLRLQERDDAIQYESRTPRARHLLQLLAQA